MSKTLTIEAKEARARDFLNRTSELAALVAERLQIPLGPKAVEGSAVNAVLHAIDVLRTQEPVVSVEMLARESGIPSTSLRRKLAGYSELNIDDYREIPTALGLRPEWLQVLVEFALGIRPAPRSLPMLLDDEGLSEEQLAIISGIEDPAEFHTAEAILHHANKFDPPHGFVFDAGSALEGWHRSFEWDGPDIYDDDNRVGVAVGWTPDGGITARLDMVPGWIPQKSVEVLEAVIGELATKLVTISRRSA